MEEERLLVSALARRRVEQREVTAATMSAPARAARQGALCYDRTFTRLLGTRGTSEPILKDLIGAWRAARTDGAAQASAEGVDVEIVERQVLTGAMPRGKGDLIADVRLHGGGDNFIVEVQHRVEPLFPRRALLYAAADLVSQHLEGPFATQVAKQRPVHTLAFCDFDFTRGREGAVLRTGMNAWRKAAPPVEPRTERAVHVYSLLPCAADMARLGQLGNGALDDELSARISFVFALLPHAPRLQDLTAATPPLLRWASLVAHVAPDNIDAVPKAVRSKGVETLMLMLRETVDATEAERRDAEASEGEFERAVDSALAEGEAKGKAEGIAESMGALGILSIADFRAKGALGILSIADFRAKFGTDPSGAIAAFFMGRAE